MTDPGLQGPSSAPQRSIQIDSSFSSISAEQSSLNMDRDHHRALLRDKKVERSLLFNEMNMIRDHILSLDAAAHPVEEVVEIVNQFRDRLTAKESEVEVLNKAIRVLAARLNQPDPADDNMVYRQLDAYQEAKRYLNAVGAWANEAILAYRSRSTSGASEHLYVQDQERELLESTPISPPRVPTSDSIRFRYSFVDTNSLAGDAGAFLQNRSPAPTAQPQQAIIQALLQLLPQVVATQPPAQPPQGPPRPTDRQLMPQSAGEQQQPPRLAQDPLIQFDVVEPPSQLMDQARGHLGQHDHRSPPPLIREMPATTSPEAEIHPRRLSQLMFDSNVAPPHPFASTPAPHADPRHAVPPLAGHLFGPDVFAGQRQSQLDKKPLHFPQDNFSLGRKARQVPKFAGDSRKYREWQQLFKVFVDDSPAPTIEKFNLLRSSLQGKAKDAIAHLQWEEAHYELAKNVLRERFGDDKLAQKSHIKELDRLIQSGLITDARLESFTESLSLNVRALTALGVSFLELSTTTTQRVLCCLPRDLREKFVRGLAERKVSDPLITDLEFMLDFLETTVKFRREAEWDSGNSNHRFRREQPHRPSEEPQRQQFRSSKPTSSRDNHAFLVTPQAGATAKKTKSKGHPMASSRPAQAPRSTFVGNPPTVSSVSRPLPTATTSLQNRATDAPHASNGSCIFCEGPHESFRCRSILSYDERVQRVQAHGACLVCLKKHPPVRSCQGGPRSNCPTCNGAHYLVMCRQRRADALSFHVSSAETSIRYSDPTAVLDPTDSVEPEILLQTAVVWLEAGKSKILARILCDPGAHRSYVSSQAARDLKSKPVAAVKTSIKTIGGIITDLDTSLHEITLRSRHDHARSLTINCIEAPEITSSILPDVEDDHGLSPIADVRSGETAPRILSIIVGAVDLAPIHTGAERKIGRMFATSSIFGWLFCGSVSSSTTTEKSLALLCEIHPKLPVEIQPNVERGLAPPALSHTDVCLVRERSRDQSLEADMKFLWDGEFMGFEPPSETEESDEQSEALSHFFETTTSRLPDGRYQLCLPFKDNLDTLGSNEALARSRLTSLLNKLKKNPIQLAAIDNEIKKSLEAGFAEPATPRHPGQQFHFLPLQAVFKHGADGTLVKTRIVKDASAKTSNHSSLNDCLHQGSNLLPPIPKVLCAFRECIYPVTADIQNAFLQFAIHPSNRSLLRFLWPLNCSTDPHAPVKQFWSTRLEFGLSSSPWCHIMGVQHHLKTYALRFPARAELINEVSDNLYMDDLVFRCNSVEEASTKISALFEIFQDAHFPLKKWSTSEPRIAAAINQCSPLEETDVTVGEASAKFLGVRWNQQKDEIGVFTEKALSQLNDNPPSKRSLLKGLAQIYDCLGILSPVTIHAKTLFQSLWKAGIGWDDPLPPDIRESYEAFVELLQRSSNLSIRRSLADRYTDSRFELHAFCDASLEAYGCALYLRTLRPGHAESNLVFAKARVAPLKNRSSIHRYELMGCLLSAKVTSQTASFLRLQISKTRFWTDNMACLSWIRSGPDRWVPFVANRVRLIASLTNPTDWFYVRTDDNPSDIVSRGTDINDPECRRRWLHGPPWLSDPTWVTPSSQTTPALTDIDSRISFQPGPLPSDGAAQQLVLVALQNKPNPVDALLSPRRYSSWYKLLRAQAWCNRLRRFAQAVKAGRTNTISAGRRATLRSSSRTESLRLDAIETRQAEIDIVKRIQRLHFPAELACNCRNIHRSSPLFQYHPFIDNDGIIRCRSRLERSEGVPFDTKYPIIIPSEGGWAQLIIANIHAKDCWHWGGTSYTLQALRKKFLILRARAIAIKVLKTCLGCQRFNARPSEEPTPALPRFRIEESSPFCYCGVDFFGPIMYRREEGGKAKGYLLIFACAVTRGIHLEVTTDMSCFEVLRALQKFLHRYPTARNIISDNGAAFHRADLELKLIYKYAASGPIADWLDENQITWTFITPAAPWTGSFYERLIGCVKRCLRKVLGTSTPYFRDLEVVMAGVEAVVNRRPLTTVATNPDELIALTPANLMTGYRGDSMIPWTCVPPTTRADVTAVAFSKRWLFQQSVLAAFWERFRSEYLAYLRTVNQRSPVAQRSLKCGDVCLLKSDEKSRAYWPIVRVVELHGSEDGEARTVSIKTTTGKILKRPVKLLYRLESVNVD